MFDSEEKDEELQRLFEEVADLPLEARARHLDVACAPNSALRQEVESLLAAMEANGGAAERKLDQLFQALHTPMNDPGYPTTDSLEGRQFAQYKLLEKIGAGGMGVVYKALDTRLERTVAMKLLPAELSLDPQAKERFVREARAASRLDHVNICTIHEISELVDDQLCIVMTYYDGETLERKLANGALPLGECVDIARQMVDGLAKAHAERIVHRDIKPANVMITRDGVVKILDFGVAKVGTMPQLTKSGSTLGTTAYMSPEQIRGEPVDHRSDIWACGVVLYQTIAGKRPYDGEYFQAIAYAIMNTEPEPLAGFKADVPPELERIVLKCLEKHKQDRYQSTALLLADLMRIENPLTAAGGGVLSAVSSVASRAAGSEATSANVFVSFDPHIPRDKQVGEALCEALRQHHTIFTNTGSRVGARWVAQVQAELSTSDYLVILISDESIRSEMVLAEIEMAHRLAGEQNGRPVILPVRLAYNEPYVYPLSAYLDDLNWAYWEADEDTPRLTDQLMRALTRGNLSTSSEVPIREQPEETSGLIPEPHAAAQVSLLEAPEGTMDTHSKFYVRRPVDDVAQNAIAQQGVTITIKGPRQMGKSSLLVRMMDAAAKAGKQVLFLDFQLFNQSALDDADTFFKQFCVWLTFKLKLQNRVEEYWQWPLGNSQCCTLYVEDCILKELGTPLVLAMDEVERVFDTSFRSDFFGMLRSWHNERAKEPIWKKLDLALVTSTEPYQLIENLNQSPFNVGEIIDLRDFSAEQVAELNRKHGTPLAHAQVDQLMGLLNGHPYLTRKALYLLASDRLTLPDLLATASDDRGPFGDHLRYHLFRLHGHQDLIQGFKEIIERRRCSNEEVFWRLQGAGLVLRDGADIVPRCSLYHNYFRTRLDG